MPPPEDLIVANGLTKQYGKVKALDGVSLSVAGGSILALLGAAGSSLLALAGWSLLAVIVMARRLRFASSIEPRRYEVTI